MREQWKKWRCSPINVKEVRAGTCWWLGTLLNAFAEAPWPRSIRPIICLSHRFLGLKLIPVLWHWICHAGAERGSVFHESPSPDDSIIRNVKSPWSLSLCDTMTLFSLLLLLIIFIVVIERCSRSTLSAKFVLLYRADAISPDLNPICLLTAKHGWKEG